MTDRAEKGKVALITGGSRGIGFATAKTFAANGFNVALCGRRENLLDEAAQILKKSGDVEVLTVKADVASPADCRRLIETTAGHFGRVDVLVNNAGEGQRQLDASLAEDFVYQQYWDQYCLSVIRVCRLVVPIMKQRSSGSIINVASLVALEPNPDTLPLGVAKAALVNFSKGLSRSLAKDGIRVNAVCPGMVWTPHRLLADQGPGERLSKKYGLPPKEALTQHAKQNIPIGRFIDVQEVADAILFLASEQASAVTGAILTVDGGSTHSY